ncbi:helix-hairpin-helix motif family protein [Collimonas arenae]|uniref:Helix-hairpin-helix motif family protein n=2 Tax=Collimonas arenae TaxID=279058 RepID=A0A127PUT9_9BURK|nr:helix-hairpin-helix motif family protein [Collimonas arenae]AMP11485.1 helix-hairpin-helix motif family protein [Collimonas arenae]
MFTRLLLVFCALMASASLALAQVDVNKGDLAALNNIKGIGAAKAKRIIDERSKGGNFKDWADFESRVPGIGEKSASQLSQAGLLVNGKAKGGVESAKNNAKGNPKSNALAATAPAKPAAKVK